MGDSMGGCNNGRYGGNSNSDIAQDAIGRDKYAVDAVANNGKCCWHTEGKADKAQSANGLLSAVVAFDGCKYLSVNALNGVLTL